MLAKSWCEEAQYSQILLSSFFFSTAVPPLIISHPSPYTHIEGNPSFNFTVEFISRLQENTTVTWQKDNIFLPEQRVKTSYISEINGVTVVNFPTISRSDAGLYRVTIKNVIPTTSMTAVGVYQLQVAGKIYSGSLGYSHSKVLLVITC